MIHTHIHNKLVLKEKDPCILFTMFLMMVLNLNKLLHYYYFFFLSLRCGVRKCCCHQICLKPQQMNNQLFGREKRSIQS